MSIAIGAASATNRLSPPQRPDPTTVAANMLGKIDTKNQGYIDKEELQAAVSKQASSQNATATTDTSQVDALFKKLDDNGDGKITKSELTDGFKKLSAEFDSTNSQVNAGRSKLERHGGPPPDAGGVPATAGTSGAAKTYDAADKNQDGTISAAELLAYKISTTENTAATSTTSNASFGNSNATTTVSQQSESQTDSGALKLLAQLARAYASSDQQVPLTGSAISVSA